MFNTIRTLVSTPLAGLQRLHAIAETLTVSSDDYTAICSDLLPHTDDAAAAA